MFKDTSSLISDNYDRLVAKFRSLLLRATPERPLGKFILIGERRGGGWGGVSIDSP